MQKQRIEAERFRKRGNRGQGMIEYALIVAFVAVVVIGVLTLFGPTIGNTFSEVLDSVGGVSTTAGPPPTYAPPVNTAEPENTQTTTPQPPTATSIPTATQTATATATNTATATATHTATATATNTATATATATATHTATATATATATETATATATATHTPTATQIPTFIEYSASRVWNTVTISVTVSAAADLTFYDSQSKKTYSKTCDTECSIFFNPGKNAGKVTITIFMGDSVTVNYKER